jgi:hypothetical protein
VRVHVFGWWLLVSAGCGGKTYLVSPGHNAPEAAHYVVSMDKRLYDCVSMPDGQVWAPTCVEVTFVKKAPEVLRKAPSPFAGGDGVAMVLVSDEQASGAPMALPTRGDGAAGAVAGPSLVVEVPDGASPVAGALGLRVRFSPGPGGAAVNPTSVRLTYLRGGGIDLTATIRPWVTADGIDLPPHRVPAGTHSFSLYVEDTDGNGTTQVITAQVE